MAANPTVEDLLTTNQVTFNNVATTTAPTILGDSQATAMPQAGAAPWHQTAFTAYGTLAIT
ncbi:hypothetical protein [Actinomadura rugatobispora]|uniref:Uncharacterized protein n=1 Tax=Actinomadura rugatobispora TaxID=1994 RepID=A0ABW0ZT54_9ACTN|nr:hypothetical protein GCM10010200_024530 [Actinomadura rugatobispora]